MMTTEDELLEDVKYWKGRADALAAALEPFAECVNEDGTVRENMCPADYREARAVLLQGGKQ